MANVDLVVCCWKCNAELQRHRGEYHVLVTQIKCHGCGELNAVLYAFPQASVHIVDAGALATGPPAAPRKRRGNPGSDLEESAS